MGWIFSFYRSSIGAKIIMAVTGASLVGFALIHFIGNMLLFAGPDALNTYAQKLHDLGALLWVMRGGLIGAFLLHIITGIKLASHNRKSNPIGYQVRMAQRSTLGGRTMAVSGIIILAFLLFHLAHFTFGVVDPSHYGATDALGRKDVYKMVVLGFQQIWIAAIYVVSMLMFGLHLSHGISSTFQTLGLNAPQYQSVTTKVGPLFAALIVIGNISMPIAVLSGCVHL